MPRSYDLVVLGAGTAAMTAASRVRDQGWSVAVIDFRPFGGTCALRGCDPKKMLIGGTSAVDHARRMRGKGVAGDARIDWSELMAFKRSFTDPVPELHERNYKSKGIDMAKFQALGIDVRTGTSVERVDQPAHEFRVWTSRDGQKQSIEADLVVHAAGRAPDFSGLNLEAAGVEVDGGRLKLNEFLQSVSNPAVYAAGDAAQVGPPLTPVSSHDAHIVAANMLKGNARRPDYRGVPSVAFTVPPIAAVGLSEEKARAQGLKFRVQSKLASTWFTARQAAEAVYGFKVLVDETTDLVLGAHLVGPHAEEVINLFALAIRHGLTASALKQTMFAYPTGASDIGYML